MKALVLKEYKRLAYEDVPAPEVGPDDVLVKIEACGICGSDVHGYDGSTGRRIPPVIMGHEAAGVVADVGAGVSDLSRGDRITFDSTVYCGGCWFCRQGYVNLCDRRRVLGVSCKDYRRDGAFAEYVAVPQRIVYRLPEDLAFEHAAMVEALSIALHSVSRTSISLNDTALVIGAGTIGLLVVQSLRAAGCGRIIAVDLDSSRLDLACNLGADEGMLSGSADVPAEVLERTNGRGADVAIEAVGISATIQTAIASLRKGGQLTLIGNVSPTVELPLQAVVTRELTLNGTCASRGDYPACLDLIARGTVNVVPLISAIAPLSEGAEWFDRLYTGERGLLKVVLKPL